MAKEIKGKSGTTYIIEDGGGRKRGGRKKTPKITIAQLESLGGNAMPESTTKADLRALARDINTYNKLVGDQGHGSWGLGFSGRDVLTKANELLGFHGVEVFTYRPDGHDDSPEGRAMEWVYDYYGGDGPEYYYLNAGDTYAETLALFDRRFHVTTWADVYEQIRSDALVEARHKGALD